MDFRLPTNKADGAALTLPMICAPPCWHTKTCSFVQPGARSPAWANCTWPTPVSALLAHWPAVLPAMAPAAPVGYIHVCLEGNSFIRVLLLSAHSHSHFCQREENTGWCVWLDALPSHLVLIAVFPVTCTRSSGTPARPRLVLIYQVILVLYRPDM